ncbi:thermonuclease family protein [Methylogaea oryzae]|uniref:TNase-like domain-containing protein n=1 Tax=Methylogaea oryzae TaxID=1295382 RepID=A0A8D5ALD5_9GAMM|nr:thermonuclease family protein [Methylogaea oryzae]BBL72734.1 hypothetical protein MoryE10_33400 [Methylogaea oryzae]
MRRRPARLIRWALLAALAAPAWADVYRWKDQAGHIHYGDRPAAGAERVAGIDGGGPVYNLVRSVHDGDTVTLESGAKVRLLGINTPEIDSATSSAEAGGDAAKRWLESRIEGRKVRLEGDAEAKDHYGRLLAHLFSEDGEHLNLALVKAGLAVVSIFPPNLKYADELAEAQRQARRERLGVWGDAAYAVRPIAELPQQRRRGWQRWSGRPTALDYSRDYARLIFSDQVDVTVPKENLGLFPPLKDLVGKTLEIRGWTAKRKERYTVLLRHPSGMDLLD